MTTVRQLKISSLVRRTISELLITEFGDQRLRDVRIVDVHLSADLSNANILYILSDDSLLSKDEVTSLLASICPRLRHLLGKRVVLRHMPRLFFVQDKIVNQQRKLVEVLTGLDS